MFQDLTHDISYTLRKYTINSVEMNFLLNVSLSSHVFSLNLFIQLCFQLLSCVRLFATPWMATRQASLSFPISRSLLGLMSIESVMPSNHLIFCCPLLQKREKWLSIRVISDESALCIRWPSNFSNMVYWSASPSGLEVPLGQRLCLL